MNLDAPIPPPGAPDPTTPPEPGRKLPFGLQVGLGFLLPVVACGVTCLGLALSGGMKGGWSGIGVFLSGVLGMLTFAGGMWFALKRGGKGVLLGVILFGALIVLLIGACFAMMAGIGRR